MRKADKNELEFIEESLMDLKTQIDNIKLYLETNVWTNLEDERKRKSEFKFQADLYDKYIVWLKSYIELTGIIDFYNENNKEKEDKLRKGFKGNELMDMIKAGDLDEDTDE